MAKASPLIRSFNAGEVSPLVEGRTDLDRYPAASRSLLNYVAAPQGPAIPRSGTQFVGTSYDPLTKSSLIGFVFSEENAFIIEFTDLRVRFFNDDGILVRPAVAATGTGTTPFTFNSPALTALGAVVGDQVALSGFADHYNLNGEVGNITAKVGDDYTIDLVYPSQPLDASIQVSLVYSIDSPYEESELEQLRDLQSLDVIYLFHPDIPTKKLRRKDTYDWDFVEADFLDGPYMDVNDTTTKLTPGTTGSAIPTMTGNTAPAGYTASASSVNATPAEDPFKAFDDQNNTTFWQCNVNQTGWLQIEAPAAFVCTGYTIYVGILNDNVSYLSKDYAPGTFRFLGSNDGVNFTTLDTQHNYVLYDNNKSLFFDLKNSVAYKYYRLEILSLTRNGTILPTVGRLLLKDAAASAITFTASATTGINNDQGFKSTDVGRLLRVKCSDNNWRSLRITEYTNATTIKALLLGEPLASLDSIQQWRLGYYSETTGYPNCGCFFQDRLFLGGSNAFPDLVVGSVSQEYENMTPTDPDGKVLDTHSIVRRLNSRRLSRIRWLAEGSKGLMCGTGSREWILAAADGSGKTVTPDNMKATASSSRGSAAVDVIPVDDQALYVQRAGRTAREFAYNYESDGYKSPSMSLLSSHLGVSPFVQMAYAAEPYSIVWMRRMDGSVVGLTYNRDENVVGWHRHDFSGGIVESIAAIPSPDGLQDVLWMVVRRVVDGNTVRYIEKLTRFWDFDMDIPDAHYVDCGLRYVGVPTDVVFGMQHLEGREDIYGLADGIPVGPFAVIDGSVTLPQEASNIILGIGFDSAGETVSLENGAQDGTAQAKIKRFNAMSLRVWQSYGGELGVWDADKREVVWTPLKEQYPAPLDVIEEINLFSDIIGPIIMAPGYEKRGSVFFRRRKDTPLPFNIIAIMPQMVTQDGG